MKRCKVFSVGDGEEKLGWKMLRQNNLKNIIFHDSVARTDAVHLLSLADCFLLPNLKGDFLNVIYQIN